MQNKGFEYYKKPLLSTVQQQRCLTIVMELDKDKLIICFNWFYNFEEKNSGKIAKV